MKRILLISIASFVAACGGETKEPAEVLERQSWATTVETVDGIPIGQKQVELETLEQPDAEAAKAVLRTRKRMLADALESPPRTADVLRRQATVQAYIDGEFAVRENVMDGLKDSDVKVVKDEIEAALTKPRGYVATLVTVSSEQASRDQLRAFGRKLTGQLGPDPTDDEVEALEGSTEVFEVKVDYAVPFASVTEAGRRPGWAAVNATGAAEIESLSDSRVTSVYSLGENAVQFMVKVDEIEGEKPDPDVVRERIREHVEGVDRGVRVQHRADQLVKERPWTFYPDVIEEAENQ